MPEKSGVTKDRKISIGQDWASVVTAMDLIIFVVAAGYTVNSPSFGGKEGWDGIGAIAGIFSSSSLLISVISTLLISGIFSAPGMFLIGDSFKNYFTGFLSVCLLDSSAISKLRHVTEHFNA
jgi:hypothetical protein